MVSYTLRSRPLCLAPPCHLAGVSVGLGCGMSHWGVRGCSSFPEGSGCSSAGPPARGFPGAQPLEGGAESPPR